MKLPPLDFEKPIAELEDKLADLKKHSRANDINFDHEVRRMEGKIEETKRAIYENLTAWQRVQIARHPARPYTLDYLQLSFSNFIELHGDRLYGDDPAIVCGSPEVRMTSSIPREIFCVAGMKDSMRIGAASP